MRFRERGQGAGVFGLIVETVPVTFRDWHCVRGIGGPGAQLLERFPEQVDEAIADKQAPGSVTSAAADPITCEQRVVDGRTRRVYRATEAGKEPSPRTASHWRHWPARYSARGALTRQFRAPVTQLPSPTVQQPHAESGTSRDSRWLSPLSRRWLHMMG